MRPVLILTLGVGALVLVALLVSATPSAAQPGIPNMPICDGMTWKMRAFMDHSHFAPDQYFLEYGCTLSPPTPHPHQTWMQRWDNQWWVERGGPAELDKTLGGQRYSYLMQALWEGPDKGRGLSGRFPIYSPETGYVVGLRETFPPDTEEPFGEACQSGYSAMKTGYLSEMVIEYPNWYLYLIGVSPPHVRIGDRVTTGSQLGFVGSAYGESYLNFSANKKVLRNGYMMPFDPFGFNEDTTGQEDIPISPTLDHHYQACDVTSERVMSPARKGGGSCGRSGKSYCPDSDIIIDNRVPNDVDFGVITAGKTDGVPPPPWGGGGGYPDPFEWDEDSPGPHGVYVDDEDADHAVDGDYHFSVAWWPEDEDHPEPPLNNIDYAYWACWDCDVSKPIEVLVSNPGWLGIHPGYHMMGDGDCIPEKCWKTWYDGAFGWQLPPRFKPFQAYQAPFQTYQVYGYRSGRPAAENPTPGFLGKGFRLLDTVTVKTGNGYCFNCFDTVGTFKFAPGETPVVISTNVVGFSTEQMAGGVIPWAKVCTPWADNFAAFDAVMFSHVCGFPEFKVDDPHEPVPIITVPPDRLRLPSATPVINPEPTLGSYTLRGVTRWSAPSTPTP